MTHSRGFTLLELLLVVGLAGVLIASGITTYSLVNKGNGINESARLTHIMLNALRSKGKGSNGTYGVAGADLSHWLINSRSIPDRYINADNTIGDPFNKGSQLSLTVDTNITQFSLAYAAPPAYVPEILQKMDIAVDPEIIYVVACGTTVWNNGSGNLDPVYITNLCGASTSPLVNSIRVVSR